MFNNKEEDFHDNQLRILQLLMERPYQQKDLAVAMNVSGAGLFYHLNILEEKNLIRKKTLAKVGTASLKEVKIDPLAYQRVRDIIGKKSSTYTLISGMGKDINDWKPSQIPATTRSLLEAEGYKISRIIAFATDESNIENAKKHTKIDEILSFPYLTYRNHQSEVYQKITDIIQEEMEKQDVILDLTPLTKLLTIKFLEHSIKYDIPCLYLGKQENDQYYLIWIYKILENQQK